MRKAQKDNETQTTPNIIINKIYDVLMYSNMMYVEYAICYLWKSYWNLFVWPGIVSLASSLLKEKLLSSAAFQQLRKISILTCLKLFGGEELPQCLSHGLAISGLHRQEERQMRNDMNDVVKDVKCSALVLFVRHISIRNGFTFTLTSHVSCQQVSWNHWATWCICAMFTENDTMLWHSVTYFDVVGGFTWRSCGCLASAFASRADGGKSDMCT